MEELTKVSHKLAEEIYKQAAAKQQKSQSDQATPDGQPEAAQEPKEKDKKDEDIIDAEYKEEDPEGKK